MTQNKEKYYLLSARNPERMLVYSMPNLPNKMSDSWTFGQQFTKEPKQPIHIEIQEGFERKTPLPFFDHPPIASKEFVDALIEIGVDNIAVYDVLLHNEDYSITYDGFQAINIIGLAKTTGKDTIYSISTDASIESLELEPNSIKDLYIFRLAESTIVVHEKVKKHLETKEFHSLVFTESNDTFIL